MNKTLFRLSVVALSVVSVAGFANTNNTSPVSREYTNQFHRQRQAHNSLKRVVSRLEKEVQRLREEFQHKNARVPSIHAKSIGDLNTALGDHIIFSGGMNMNGVYSNRSNENVFTGAGNKSLRLNAAFINMHALLTPWLSGYFSLNDEPDQRNTTGGIGGLEVLQAYLHAQKQTSKVKYFLNAGKLFVPFGVYKIHPVMNSFSQVLDETVKYAVDFGIARKPFFASAYIFNAQGTSNGFSAGSQVPESKQIYNGGLEVGALSVNQNSSYDVSLGYINNMAESRAIFGLIPATSHKVGNFAFHADMTYHKFGIIFDASMPANRFYASDITFNGQGARPSSYAIEINDALPIAGRPGNIGLSFQRSYQALFVGLPEYRYTLSYSYFVNKYLSTIFEVVRSKDYSTSDSATYNTASGAQTVTGTGLWNNAAIIQVAAHF